MIEGKRMEKRMIRGKRAEGETGRKEVRGRTLGDKARQNKEGG